MKKYFALKGREILLKMDGSDLTKDDLAVLAGACGCVERFCEEANQIEVLGVERTDTIPEGYTSAVLRAYFNTHSEEEVVQVARAKALLEWRQSSHFCPRCGKPLQEHDKETARICPDCGQMVYPRIDPCVIVLVNKDGQILLANHVQRNQDIYACIAGFVEAGESIEHAVEREIFEETHLKVKNIRYFGSQSWPFPSQLMFGFTADYESGEIELQAEEIADARWFDPDHCPASPQPGSIAYQLIENAKKLKHNH